jgi:hypothetical protein
VPRRSAQPPTVAMTDTRTLVAHLVTDDAVAVGRRAGRYVGVCGVVVLPGSLQEDTDRSCRSCQLRGREARRGGR